MINDNADRLNNEEEKMMLFETWWILEGEAGQTFEEFTQAMEDFFEQLYDNA